MDASEPKNLSPDLEYKKSAVTYWRSRDETNRRKSRSIEEVKQKYSSVKSLSQLYEWERAVKKEGTRFDKLRAISRHVRDKFASAVADNKTIHDKDLRDWALEANQEVKLKDFIASRSWILSFKRSSGISLRNLSKAAETDETKKKL